MRRLIYPQQRCEGAKLFVCDGCGVAIWSVDKPACVLPMCKHREPQVRVANREELAEGERKIAC